MIKVDKLTKSFGQTKAVNNLSFSINPGEVVGLLGPNGAGKTTTMRLITGYLTPDSGQITVDDISVIDNSIEAQKKIGYLPENNPLYKEMLVSEILEYSAGLKNLTPLKKKSGIDFAVTHVGIEDVYNRPISELSKGYKQRVGIALALLHQPEILIMDEPSEGLDPNQRFDVRTLIKNLSKNHTIIISTHVMAEVEAVCDRLIIINKGQLVADGTADALIRKTHSSIELTIDIEGHNVLPKLKQLSGLNSIDIVKKTSNRLTATLMVKKNIKIQPQISQMCARNKWIIWGISEQKRQLEDVFAQLTK